MKSLSIVLALLALSTLAHADPLHPTSRFVIDWSDPSTLNPSDGLSCPGVTNTVVIVVPGVFNRDFTIRGTDETCKVVSVRRTEGTRGDFRSTVVLRGQCAGDNDETFTVDRSGSSEKAHITVDSGC